MEQVAPPLKSLATALEIVSALAGRGTDVSVAELSRSLGIEKSKVSRVLTTFRRCGWLAQNPRTKSYRVGLRAYALGAEFLYCTDLTRAAMPLMRAIARRTGLTTALSVLDGTNAFYVAGIEGATPLDFGARIGTPFPIHATAPGHVLLAFSDDAVANDILREPRMPQLPTRTPWDVASIRAAIAGVRERGFAASRGGRIERIGGIAVPIFNGAQNLSAALSVVFSLDQMSAGRQAECRDELFAAAREVSMQLGAQSYPFGVRQLQPHPRRLAR
jgi:IclR family pca regulon transcriptional regulator